MRTNFTMDKENIKLIRGDTFSFGMEIEDSAGDGLDLDSAYFTIKKSFADASPAVQKSIGNGITRQNAGQYVIRVAPEDTAELEAGKYYYDLQISKNGDVFTVLFGVLTLLQDVTEVD